MTNHPHQRFHFKVLTLWVRISPYEFGKGEHKYSDHNISSTQFSHSVVSDPLRPHGLQDTRLPCPSPYPGVCSNSCLLIESVRPSNHLILCCPLLLLPSIFPSTRVFSKQSVLHIMWPKYWSFSISPSSEYSELISFRMAWLDLLAV